jgi:CHASE3 domain sensor protein
MTKDQRLKAMGKVISACQQIKDKKPLAEAVRKIVDDLRAEEKAHREAAAAEHTANLVMKINGEKQPPT